MNVIKQIFKNLCQRNHVHHVILSIILIISANTTFSQTKSHIVTREQPFAKLFENSSILHITITGDIKSIIRDIDENRTKHDAILSYFDADSIYNNIAIKIKTRGIFRRSRQNCNFPPLKIYFDESYNQSTIFEDICDLKLVTHCKQNRQYQQNVAKEYIVYKLWELTSQYSFHVRPLIVTYSDISDLSNNNIFEGFFIEDQQSVMRTHNGYFSDALNVHQDKTDRFEMTKLGLFEFMIGNTDWSVPAQHNTLLFVTSFKRPPVVFPYDFDCCGLVNAPYAQPQPELGIASVTERKYRGFPRSDGELQMAINIFNLLKADYWKVIDNTTILNNDSKQEIKDYLEEFYEIINSEKLIRKHIKQKARAYSKGINIK